MKSCVNIDVTSWGSEYVTNGTTTYTNYIDTGMDGHLAMVPGGDIATIEYFSTDERGNVVALVNASGTILERYRYTVYGKPTIMEADFSPSSATEALSPFLWGGSYMDYETGLYWIRNRYYHIGMKRFINQDPIGIWGDANNLGNGFAYVAGMVIEHTDPTGLMDDWNSWSKIEGKDYMPKSSGNAQGLETINTAINRTAEIVKTALTSKDAPTMVKGAGQTLMSVPNKIISKIGAFLVANAKEIGAVCVALGNPEKMNNLLSTLIRGLFDSSEKLGGIITQGLNNLYDAITEGQSTEKQVEIIDNMIKDIEKMNLDQATKDELKKKMEELKKEIIANSAGKSYPADPDNNMDALQNFLSSNAINRILGPKGKAPKKKGDPKDIEEWEKNPIVPYKGEDGTILFVRNPFYREPDLLHQLFIQYEDENGKKRTILNPFRAPAEYDRANTYDKIKQGHKWFYQPEVDPWFK